MRGEPTELDLAWAVLESQTGEFEGLRVAGTGAELPSGEALIGIGADGNRHLLLPLPEDAAFAQDTATRGVHMVRRSLDTGQRVSDFVDLECRLPHLSPVFVTLCGDILDALPDVAEQPAVACRIVLDRWREFLGSERSPLMSEERLVGLIAELCVLRDVLEHDPARRLDVWRGPSGAVHDLRRGSDAIEVKGTRLREGTFVPIHGVEQLMIPPGGTLHLSWLRFESDETGPLSVPGIGRDLREMGVDMLALAGLLVAAGYDASHTPEYERRRYRLVDSRAYLVDEDFPRVVPGSFTGERLPPGILRLSYTVDLTNEPPTPISRAETTELLRRLGAG